MPATGGTITTLSPLVDGRQSQTASAIARGTARYLHALGYCVVSEL
ncbi:MAG TPA: MmcB family DNA repair protein, partial [Xanthobacteraceae bacterium]